MCQLSLRRKNTTGPGARSKVHMKQDLRNELEPSGLDASRLREKRKEKVHARQRRQHGPRRSWKKTRNCRQSVWLELEQGKRQDKSIRLRLEQTTQRRACNPLQYSCLKNRHGQRSLVGYSPRGRKESDTTEATQHTHRYRCMKSSM